MIEGFLEDIIVEKTTRGAACLAFAEELYQTHWVKTSIFRSTENW